MRCNAYTFKDSGLDFKDDVFDLDKEYLVEIKARWGDRTFKSKGKFVSDGIEIKFFGYDDTGGWFYNLNRIIKLYNCCKAKEDKSLFDNKKVQIYARYKKCTNKRVY